MIYLCLFVLALAWYWAGRSLLAYAKVKTPACYWEWDHTCAVAFMPFFACSVAAELIGLATERRKERDDLRRRLEDAKTRAAIRELDGGE